MKGTRKLLVVAVIAVVALVTTRQGLASQSNNVDASASPGTRTHSESLQGLNGTNATTTDATVSLTPRTHSESLSSSNDTNLTSNNAPGGSSVSGYPDYLKLETEARAAASARLTSPEHFQQQYLEYLSGVGATIKDTTASPTRQIRPEQQRYEDSIGTTTSRTRRMLPEPLRNELGN